MNALVKKVLECMCEGGGNGPHDPYTRELGYVVGREDAYHIKAKHLVMPLLLGVTPEYLVLELVEDIVPLMGYLLECFEQCTHFVLVSFFSASSMMCKTSVRSPSRISRCFFMPSITLYWSFRKLDALFVNRETNGLTINSVVVALHSQLPTHKEHIRPMHKRKWCEIDVDSTKRENWVFAAFITWLLKIASFKIGFAKLPPCSLTP